MFEWLLKLFRKDPVKHWDGKCFTPGCGGDGLMFVNGQNIYCWDCYTDMVKRK